MQQKWEDYYKTRAYFRLEPHPALIPFADKCASKGYRKMLDLGCGTGADMLALAEKGFEVTGVEFSPSAASNAEDLLQSKGFSAKVYVDNLFDKVTTFAQGEFPAIIAINSLEYTDLEVFTTSINEITRLLDSKGLFLLVVSSKDSPLGELGETEQIFFSEEQLGEIVSKHFRILDFFVDGNSCYCLILEKVN